jgi:hypothetical protein
MATASVLFIRDLRSRPRHLPAAAQGLIDLDDRGELVAGGRRQVELGAEELALLVEDAR